MKTTIALVVVPALALGSACARKPPPGGARASDGSPIAVTESIHDFGQVTEGDKPTHAFRLSNAGAVPIALERVEPNCECLGLSLDRKPIAPGAAAEILVTFDTLGRTGDQEKLVTVAPAAPAAPPVELRVRARVEPLVDIPHDPDEKEEDEDMFFGDTATRQVWFAGKRAATARLAVERTTSPDLGAEIVTKTEGGAVRQGLKMTVRATALGHHHALVMVSTGIEMKPKLVHFVEWNVFGNVTVAPRALHFETGGPSGVSGAEEQVAVVKSRLEGFVVNGSKSKSPAFRAEVRRTDPRGAYELRVRVADRQLFARTQVADVELSTNDKVQPVINVPITVSAALARTAVASASAPARASP
jgi:hypothetical protein